MPKYSSDSLLSYTFYCVPFVFSPVHIITLISTIFNKLWLYSIEIFLSVVIFFFLNVFYFIKQDTLLLIKPYVLYLFYTFQNLLDTENKK